MPDVVRPRCLNPLQPCPIDVQVAWCAPLCRMVGGRLPDLCCGRKPGELWHVAERRNGALGLGWGVLQSPPPPPPLHPPSSTTTARLPLCPGTMAPIAHTKTALPHRPMQAMSPQSRGRGIEFRNFSQLDFTLPDRNPHPPCPKSEQVHTPRRTTALSTPTAHLLNLYGKDP